MDLEESLRSSRVLQGQENESLVSPFRRTDARACVLDFEMPTPAYRSLVPAQVRKANNSSFELSRVNPQTYMRSKAANKFLEVLQGREICKLKSLKGNHKFNLVAGKPFLSCSSPSQGQPQKFNAPPPRSFYFPFGEMKSGQDPVALCITTKIKDGPNNTEEISASPKLWKNQMTENDGNCDRVDGCKLFGFPLTAEEALASASQTSGKRSCTKVSFQMWVYL